MLCIIFWAPICFREEQ